MKRPHLVLIVADTLRQDYLGSYGFAGNVSLAIDQFARGSVVFENAISPAPWTRPAVGSMFTSLPPEVHGLTQITGGKSQLSLHALNERIPTIASELKREGYETVALYANSFLDPASGLGRGFDRYESIRSSGTQLTAEAISVLNRATEDQPLFLYVHYLDPHGPYTCDKANYEALKGSPSLGADRDLSDDDYTELRYLKDTKTPWLDETKPRRTLKYWRTCYAAGIKAFDDALRPLLNVLTVEPRANDTAVIFTSDHGEALLDKHPTPRNRTGWEHGWNLHFHQTRIPMIVRLPGGSHAGKRVSSMATGLDVAPTLLEMAGVSPASFMQGRNLVSILEDPESVADRWIFSSGVKLEPNVISVQNERFKMIINTKNGDLSLYNLNRDHAERRDISAKKPERVTLMRSIVAERTKSLRGMRMLPEQTRELPQQSLEQLRAMGYIEE